MKKRQIFIPIILIYLFSIIMIQCEKESQWYRDTKPPNIESDPGTDKEPSTSGDPDNQIAINNISFPVIWAEGVSSSTTDENLNTPKLNGVFYYHWGTIGTDDNTTPASCLADPDASNDTCNPDRLYLCDDGIVNSVNLKDNIAPSYPADQESEMAKVYIQKDSQNKWQATTFDGSSKAIEVDYIDWSDNLESTEGLTNSLVSIELAIYKILKEPAIEFEMKHVDGLGNNKIYGLATDLFNNILYDKGELATVYSNCARLTIQKLTMDPSNGTSSIIWNSTDKLWQGDRILPPIYNKAVYEVEEGLEYFSAQTNMKGKVTYRYSWDINKQCNLNREENTGGYYRITFSFDATDGINSLNTFFREGITQILKSEKYILDNSNNEISSKELVPQIIFENNLTYIDVYINPKETGGGSDGPGSGGNGPGGGNGSGGENGSGGGNGSGSGDKGSGGRGNGK